MMRTEDRTLARQIARIELHVVFPTPPFPPTKTHLRDSWSRMFCTVASGKSAAIAIASSTCEMIFGVRKSLTAARDFYAARFNFSVLEYHTAVLV